MRISDWSSDVCSSDLDLIKQCGNSGARSPGNRIYLFRACFPKLRGDVLHQFRVEQVALVKGQQLWLFLKARTISRKLVLHNFPSRDMIVPRCIDPAQSHSATPDMTPNAGPNNPALSYPPPTTQTVP